MFVLVTLWTLISNRFKLYSWNCLQVRIFLFSGFCTVQWVINECFQSGHFSCSDARLHYVSQHFPLLSHSNKWSPLFDTVIVSGVTKCNTQQCFASMCIVVWCDIVSMVYFCNIQCYSDLDYIAVECNPLSSANHTRILIHGLANVGQN